MFWVTWLKKPNGKKKLCALKSSIRTRVSVSGDEQKESLRSMAEVSLTTRLIKEQCFSRGKRLKLFEIAPLKI